MITGRAIKHRSKLPVGLAPYARDGNTASVHKSAGPTILISSAGRRVELLRAFRQTLTQIAAADQLNPGRVLAVDSSWYSSAFHDADEAFLVPRCTDPDFVPHMLNLCTSYGVDLIVPTIDPELPVYATAREQFAAIGTTVAISSPEVTTIAADKVHTHRWLTREGFPTVLQGSVTDVQADPATWQYPLMAKPRFGSASKGVTLLAGPIELDRLISDWPRLSAGADPHQDLIIQSVARGAEYTVDVLVSRDRSTESRVGLGVAAVPRRRIEARAGEVSKAVTVRSPILIELAENLCAALPGAYGPLNIQMFLDSESGTVAVIELNARFGGGYPLSFAAGANYPQALIHDACGLPAPSSLQEWRNNLAMLRYDAAVFVVDPGPGKNA
jgi:carbamoyl-phosphate synthase large subunit